MAPEPANRIHLALIDMLGGRVHDAFPDEAAEHQSQNDLSRLADIDRQVASAFQR